MLENIFIDAIGLFGGYTFWKAYGGYMFKDKKIEVNIETVIIEIPTNKPVEVVKKFAERIARDFNQESAGFINEGNSELIFPEYK